MDRGKAAGKRVGAGRDLGRDRNDAIHWLAARVGAAVVSWSGSGVNIRTWKISAFL